MNVVFLFPGQSSRHPGMLEAPLAAAPGTLPILDRASDALGRDLRADFAEDAAAPFERNEDVQIGVFVANHLWMRALQLSGVDAGCSLGLSLGEYNHLVHVGALGFDDALRLVRARGRAYDAGPSGCMVAAQPVTLEEAEQAAALGRERGLVEVVNLNSPRQHVLAGEPAAVEAAARWLEDEVYAHTVVIERRLPMHSSLFCAVADALLPALREAPFRAPGLPYVPNRLGGFVERPTRADFVRLLAEHVHSPVLWRASLDAVRQRLPGATLVEVGPGRVLTNLVHRRWFEARLACVGARDATPESFRETVRFLQEAEAPEELQRAV